MGKSRKEEPFFSILPSVFLFLCGMSQGRVSDIWSLMEDVSFYNNYVIPGHKVTESPTNKPPTRPKKCLPRWKSEQMFSGFVNIWNYFSENVTALRMRDKRNFHNYAVIPILLWVIVTHLASVWTIARAVCFYRHQLRESSCHFF